MEVELRHLHSFLVLAEELHFGRAAERLGVVQPALSRQIRGLEVELGTALFDRSSRPIALTSAGVAFLSEARVAVRHAERAVVAGRRAGRGEIGQLAVENTFWAYTAILPAVVRAFRARAPNVRLELATASGPTQQVERLEKELVDVCFTAFGHWSVKRRALQVEPLLEDPMTAIVPDHHGFAERPEIELAELASEPLIMLSHAIVPGLLDRQMAIFHERGLSPTLVQEAPDPLALFSLIGAGLGVGIHMASFATLRPPGVSFVPIAGNPGTAKLLLLWRRDDEREVLRMFLDTAREVAARRPAPNVLRQLPTSGA